VPVVIALVLEFRIHDGPAQTPPLAPVAVVPGDDFFKGAYALDTPLVIAPKVKRMQQPKYTSAAMREKIQGIVEIDAIVMPDGTVGRSRIARSLDAVLGLDDNALAAAAEWLFEPALLNGQPVPVVVRLTLEFRLH